ncbi:MAG: sulfatase-like hydrolase/transferase [Planctomyces sp.]
MNSISVVFGGEVSSPVRLNVLHIHADDFRPDLIGALKRFPVETPNLDAIAAQGLQFSACYTQGSMTGAVCLPSRIMMLTGRSWHRIPERNDALAAEQSLPALLNQAGYQTFHAGKASNEFSAALKEFNQSIAMDDRSAELRRNSSRRHADAVIQFLRQRDREKPFYVYMSPPVPHDARIAEPQFHLRAQKLSFELSPAFAPLHPFDNGEMTVRDEKLAPWPRTIEDTHSQLTDYFACISGLDFHVGRILDYLNATDSRENTLIIFSGDNGLSMGDHGLFGKQNLYEYGGMHTALMISGPGIPAAETIHHPVYLMDLFPTICEASGVKIPSSIDAKSLFPLIRKQTAEIRPYLYTGYRDCMRAIRDQRWKLIRYPLVDRTQLFDLNSDPMELHDLSAHADHQQTAGHLMSELQREMHLFDDPVPLTVKDVRPAEWTPPVIQER